MEKKGLWKAFVDMDILACNILDDLEQFGSENVEQYRKQIARIEKEVKMGLKKK